MVNIVADIKGVSVCVYMCIKESGRKGERGEEKAGDRGREREREVYAQIYRRSHQIMASWGRIAVAGSIGGRPLTCKTPTAVPPSASL